MDRKPEDRYVGRVPRGVRERTVCDRCGKTVRIRPEDYEREEILCPNCVADAKASRLRDPDFDGRI